MSDDTELGHELSFDDGLDGTVENRVYLFKDLAAALLSQHGAGLVSGDAGARERTLRALGDLAFAACVLADRDDLEAEDVAALVAGGFERSREQG